MDTPVAERKIPAPVVSQTLVVQPITQSLCYLSYPCCFIKITLTRFTCCFSGLQTGSPLWAMRR